MWCGQHQGEKFLGIFFLFGRVVPAEFLGFLGSFWGVLGSFWGVVEVGGR